MSKVINISDFMKKDPPKPEPQQTTLDRFNELQSKTDEEKKDFIQTYVDAGLVKPDGDGYLISNDLVLMAVERATITALKMVMTTEITQEEIESVMSKMDTLEKHLEDTTSAMEYVTPYLLEVAELSAKYLGQ